MFGLSLYTSEREIQDLYSKFGGVERVQVIHDHIVSWWGGDVGRGGEGRGGEGRRREGRGELVRVF